MGWDDWFQFQVLNPGASMHLIRFQAGLDFILPAVADGMSFSATGITLAVIRRQLKDLHKKVDLLLGSVGETAKDKFEEAMVSLENDNFRC